MVKSDLKILKETIQEVLPPHQQQVFLQVFMTKQSNKARANLASMHRALLPQETP